MAIKTENDLFNILNNEDTLCLDRFLKRKGGNFISLSGLNNPLKLLLISHLLKQDKKVLFLVNNEQISLKYQNDFKTFDVESDIFPYQETPLYEDVLTNKYIYQEQVNILCSGKNLVIAPVTGLASLGL